MKVLVTGRDGQLATSLAERGARTPFDWHFAGRDSIDLATRGSFSGLIQQLQPDLVINAAAFTGVDQAEKDQALARQVNAYAAGEGARAAASIGASFMQISTDYVFDGSGTRGWREEDVTAPINAYGRTKAEGERQVLAASARHSVIRTSWLIGPFGTNFAKTMLRLAGDRDMIRVVDDQFGCPTSTLDLADALIALSKQTKEGRTGGIWHLAGSGAACWADLAQCVLEVSRRHGGPSARIERVSSAEYPTPARRPANSVLDSSKAREQLGISLPAWREAVARFVPGVVAAA